MNATRLDTSAPQRLVAAAAQHAGADVLHWQRRVERLLGAPLQDLAPAPASSALNCDGMPLQLCLSFGPGPARSRLICDPAYAQPDPARRHAQSLASALVVCQEAGVGATAERVLAHPRLATGGSPFGPLWLAFGRASGGVALYLNSRLDGDDGKGQGDGESGLDSWAAFLDDVTSKAARCAAAAWYDASQHRLAAIGLDLAPAGVAALTLYVRPRHAVPGALARFAGTGAGAALLCALGADTAQPAAGVTGAVCVTVPEGRLAACKVDLCRCPRCRGHDAAPAEWALLGLDPALAALDLARGNALALVGVAAHGERPHFRPHANLYLEPVVGRGLHPRNSPCSA